MAIKGFITSSTLVRWMGSGCHLFPFCFENVSQCNRALETTSYVRSGLGKRDVCTSLDSVKGSFVFFVVLACHLLVLDGFDQLLSFGNVHSLQAVQLSINLSGTQRFKPGKPLCNYVSL